LEEAVDLSCDRLLMMMSWYNFLCYCILLFYCTVHCYLFFCVSSSCYVCVFDSIYCNVTLPPCVNSVAVNKYLIYYLCHSWVLDYSVSGIMKSIRKEMVMA
jgi:hypothetical protein